MDPAVAFENFLGLNDGIKAMLVGMPSGTVFAVAALFLDHLRKQRSASHAAEDARAKVTPSRLIFPENHPDQAPNIHPSPAPERHAEMRDIMEEIRARSSALKNRE